MSPDDHHDRIEGTLLGTAVGDALGLPAEGLSPTAIARRFGRIDRYHFLGRTGFVSDDTEQSALVAQCLARHPDDAAACVRAFRRALLGWFLRLPWGIGMATLRACVRIALGFSESGVASAGNGAAMRSAIVGAALPDPARRRTLSDALARVTHTDPRAVAGARFVSEIAATPRTLSHSEACYAALAVVEEPTLRAAIQHALALAHRGDDSATAARELGTTGFVVHTLGFAVFVFVRWSNDPFRALQEAVSAGGDTDSIGAIVGAWCGALHGTAWIPKHLLDNLQGGPFGRAHLSALAADLAYGRRPTARYAPALALVRNLALYPVVLAHGLRRLIPW